MPCNCGKKVERFRQQNGLWWRVGNYWFDRRENAEEYAATSGLPVEDHRPTGDAQ